MQGHSNSLLIFICANFELSGRFLKRIYQLAGCDNLYRFSFRQNGIITKSATMKANAAIYEIATGNVWTNYNNYNSGLNFIIHLLMMSIASTLLYFSSLTSCHLYYDYHSFIWWPLQISFNSLSAPPQSLL